MTRLVTLDDFIETYTKLRQRGLSFILSKFTFNEITRAKTAFNHNNLKSANWSIVPKVIERCRLLITGGENISVEEFTVKHFFQDRKNLKMISLGSGTCSTEIKFAAFDIFEEILCIDIADKRLNSARKIAKENNLTNIKFEVNNVNDYNYPEKHYDIVFFSASLHHFKNVDNILGNLVKKTLKKDGLLIINEVVGPNRFQFPKHQIKAANDALLLVPKKFRKRFKLEIYKNKIYGSGLIRMIVADPSECVDSQNIIPSIRKYYKAIYEVGYGGNIIMPVLKDLGHHFLEMNIEKENVLKTLFEFEDNYIKKYESDFIFGIYKVS